MRRRLVRVGDGWALPLTVGELLEIGVDGADVALLVRPSGGDPPRLTICRAPTFDEAMEATLTTHEAALRTLAAVPDEIGDGNDGVAAV
jgi:hypothetical protein